MADERDEENPFRLARIEKLKALRAMGIDPYPYGFTVTATAKELEQRYAGLATGAETQDRVAVAGRIRATRNSGLFIDLPDAPGKPQIFSHTDHLTPGPLATVKLHDL